MTRHHPAWRRMEVSRTRRRLTQQELADTLRVDLSTYHDWSYGTEENNIQKVAVALEVDASWLNNGSPLTQLDTMEVIGTENDDLLRPGRIEVNATADKQIVYDAYREKVLELLGHNLLQAAPTASFPANAHISRTCFFNDGLGELMTLSGAGLAGS